MREISSQISSQTRFGHIPLYGAEHERGRGGKQPYKTTDSSGCLPPLIFRVFPFNRKSGCGPAIKTGLKMGDVGKAHLFKHVRRKGRPSAAGSVQDHAFFGIDPVLVIR